MNAEYYTRARELVGRVATKKMQPWESNNLVSAVALAMNEAYLEGVDKGLTESSEMVKGCLERDPTLEVLVDAIETMKIEGFKDGI